MVEEYIKNLCNILNITQPKISYDTSGFLTDTMLAMAKSDGSTIHIKKMERPTPDLMFAIAHELRHIWQAKHSPELMEGYKVAGTLPPEEYNSQPAEVDAHAFAMIVMVDMFGITPQFFGFSEQLKSKIKKRADAISSTLSEN